MASIDIGVAELEVIDSILGDLLGDDIAFAALVDHDRGSTRVVTARGDVEAVLPLDDTRPPSGARIEARRSGWSLIAATPTPSPPPRVFDALERVLVIVGGIVDAAAREAELAELRARASRGRRRR